LSAILSPEGFIENVGYDEDKLLAQDLPVRLASRRRLRRAGRRDPGGRAAVRLAFSRPGRDRAGHGRLRPPARPPAARPRDPERQPARRPDRPRRPLRGPGGSPRPRFVRAPDPGADAPRLVALLPLLRVRLEPRAGVPLSRPDLRRDERRRHRVAARAGPDLRGQLLLPPRDLPRFAHARGHPRPRPDLGSDLPAAAEPLGGVPVARRPRRD